MSLGLVLKPRELLLLVASQAVKDCCSGLKGRKCKTASMWPCLFAGVNVVEGVREEALPGSLYWEESRGKAQEPSNSVWIPVTQVRRVPGRPQEVCVHL